MGDGSPAGLSEGGSFERLFRVFRNVLDEFVLPADRVVHYSVHEELDVRHSDDFFATLQPAWNGDVRARYAIEQGPQLGAYAFDRLYRDMWEARARRVRAPLRHPQPRVYAE